MVAKKDVFEETDEEEDIQVRVTRSSSSSSPSTTKKPSQTTTKTLLLDTPTSTALRLLSDARVDERLPLSTHHVQGFLATSTVEFADVGGIHALAARGERRIRHATHVGCGVVRITLMFPAVFLLTCLQCLVKYILQPLAVGVVEIVVDGVLKPLLVVVFNQIFSPALLLVHNSFTALSAAAVPVFGIVKEMAGVVATVLSSIRLVNVEVGNKRDAEEARNPRQVRGAGELQQV